MGFLCTGKGKRERVTCMDGLWSGGKNSALASSLGLQSILFPWLERQTLPVLQPAPRSEDPWISSVEQQWRAVAAGAKHRAGTHHCGCSSAENHIHSTAPSELGSPRPDNCSQMSLVRCQVMIMCVENPISSTNLYCMLLSHVTGLFRG